MIRRPALGRKISRCAPNFWNEQLESRLLFSQVTFNVTNTNDSGAGSLRQAITQANLIAPADSAVIQFKIVGSGVHTVKPLSGLPFITCQVDIVGQTDSSGNPLTEIDGEHAGSFSDGLFLDRNTPGNNVSSEITGLVINRFGSTGIDVHSGSAIIFGCRIGTNPAGTSALGNHHEGILLEGQGSTIGENASGKAFAVLISGNNANGITITSNKNTIQNCFIGTDVTGTKAIPNDSWGIEDSGTDNNLGVGGSHSGLLVSGNDAGGIHLTGKATEVDNCKIGTDTTGNKALGNKGNGVELDGAFGCGIGDLGVVGGPNLGDVISGNLNAGVVINNSNETFITGNKIGTNAAGTAALGNKAAGVFIGSQNCVVQINVICANGFDGVVVEEDAFKADNNSIQSNFIGIGVGGQALGNKGDGVLLNVGTKNLVAHNKIAFNQASGEDGYGVDVLGHAATGNTITQNSIFSNARLGINLGLETGKALANDNKDPDTGPNNLQNYPIITSVKKTAAGIVIKGSLNSTVNSKFHLEFFASTSPDPSGFGEGQTYVSSKSVTTSATGVVTFTVTLKPVSGELYWTATATDAGGNTSEFSKAVKQV
jgi:hypothetical protein